MHRYQSLARDLKVVSDFLQGSQPVGDNLKPFVVLVGPRHSVGPARRPSLTWMRGWRCRHQATRGRWRQYNHGGPPSSALCHRCVHGTLSTVWQGRSLKHAIGVARVLPNGTVSKLLVGGIPARRLTPADFSPSCRWGNDCNFKRSSFRDFDYMPTFVFQIFSTASLNVKHSCFMNT